MKYRKRKDIIYEKEKFLYYLKISLIFSFTFSVFYPYILQRIKKKGVFMRKVRVLAIIATSILLVTGCATQEEQLDSKISSIKTEICSLEEEKEQLEQEKQKLETEVSEKKVENGTAVYIVTINISQEHPVWDMENNIKDSMNDVDIDIPVNKEFYDSVEVGTVLNDSFRTGSFIISGSIGSWNIKVTDKKIE